MSDLKPCPVCGSTNLLKRHETVDYKSVSYFVSCANCSYRGPTIWHEGAYSKQYERHSVRLWNRKRSTHGPKPKNQVQA